MRANFSTRRQTCADKTLPSFVQFTELADFLAAFPQRNVAQSPTQTLVEPLDNRETGSLAILVRGLSDREIETRLLLSAGTIKTHIRNIFSKLGVRDRAQASDTLSYCCS